MRKLTLLFALSALSAVLWAQKPLNQLRSDVTFLADDRMEGRAIGTKGEQMAADYIAGRFVAIGVSAKGTDGYFQSFSRKREPNPHSTAPVDTGRVTGRNVLAFIDNAAATTVVIGAHYDHLGYGEEGSLHSGDKEIHNGADDNASGVAVLLQLAQKLKSGPKGNNYLFIAFSGEENGLWGSTFFTREPTVELGSVNYMINMDMVGRLNDESTLAVNGVGTSPLWKPTVEELGNGRFKFVFSESGIGPSDHTSFYLKDIPVLHFFTGQHDDYHKPTDDVDKVNFEGMLKVGGLIYNIVVALDDDGRLQFVKTKDEDSRKAPKFSVTLGVVPDYLHDGKGMRISGVKEDRPAANAKLQEGDIVIRLGDIEVIDMMSYMKGLASFKKGDRTTVVVIRDGKQLKRKVKF